DSAATGAAPPVTTDSLAGTVRATLTLAGTLDTTVADGLRGAATIDGRDLVYGGLRAGALTMTAAATALRSMPTVTLAASADSIGAGSVTFSRATAHYAGTTAAGRYDVTMGSDSGLSLAGAGHTVSAGDSTVVALDSARLVPRPGHLWTLAAPTRFVVRGGTALAPGTGETGGVLALDPFTLRGEGEDVGSRLTLAATLPERGPVTGAFDATAVSIQDVAEVAGAGRTVLPVDGRLDATARLTGTRAEPLITARAGVGALRLGTGTGAARLDSATLATDYAAHRLRLDLGAFAAGRRLLEATGSLPVDLALEPSAGRLPQGTAPADSLRARVRADSLDLALVAALAPGVHDAHGHLAATFDVSGTWKAPRLDGDVQIPAGALSSEASGTRFEDIHADVALLGDSVAVRRFSVRSGAAGDTLALAGWVTLSPADDPALALRVTARDFLAVDRPRLATLTISTPTPLDIRGTFRAATVAGAVRAERGRIYIPELVDKRIIDLNEYRDVVDTTVFRNRTLLPGAPASFVENLALNDVRLSVGDDVWLRNAEANIKLGGSLAVTRAVVQVNGRAVPQLALLGSLAVERGTYRLDLLPLAQPTFDVQPGTLRFFGAGDLNPTLDIRAVHVVRQTRQFTNSPDVHVQVAIGGTLNQPTLQLSSADNPPIPDTDLISYLVTGEPAAAIFGNAQSSDQLAAAASIVSRLAGSLVSGALSRGNGPFDIISVETGAVTADPALARSTNSFSNILSSTRLGVGGQLGQKTFYTFSTGFCSFSQNSDASTSLFNNFTRGLGVRVERRVTNTFSVQLGVEPALQQQACLTNATTRYFQQTPSQGSLDFTKRWTF
ncbi:MAG TPA: translocation/assembly module TamB domain-containing protein, partial [Gemmatirosa sp.]